MVVNLYEIFLSVNFFDSQVTGVKALMQSVDLAPEEDQEEPSKLDLWLEKKLGNEKFQQAVIGIAVALGLGLSIGLFFLLPTLLGTAVTFVTDSMREAIPLIDRKLRGFNHPDAILTAVESRSSSPVRIGRDSTGPSPVTGLYPCGEGAGYAGGIVSAAVDGIRVAEAVATAE